MTKRRSRKSRTRGVAAADATGVPTPAPAGWLVKTEPSSYSVDDLERDGTTAWEGVGNPLARRHLRAMRIGDPVFLYHTGGEKRIVGLARVARSAYPEGRPDAKDSPDSGPVAVDLAFVARAKAPVPLSEVRADPACDDLALVRIPRLSVMPVGRAAFESLRSHAGLPER